MNINMDSLHDYIVAHGMGEPTALGLALAIDMLQAGEDYATAAYEVVARGMTQEGGLEQ